MSIIVRKPPFIPLDNERVKDLRELLRRGLNCWEARPEWLQQLQIELRDYEHGNEKQSGQV